MIFGPDGKPLCESLGDGEEGILKADVDLRDIDYPKAFIDVVGHCKKIRLGPRTRILFAPRISEIPFRDLSWSRVPENHSKVSYVMIRFKKILTLCVVDARPDLLSLLVNPTQDTHVTKMSK